MNERIGIFVAWPYANGDVHLGHVAGAYLPPDIFARYHRLRGNQVLMVSGSDSHGTPITVAASHQGVTPKDVFERYHQRFLQNWTDLGISFDLFTHTNTENHAAISQDIFRALYDKGYVYPQSTTQLFCEVDQRFLPDRYVEGTCPHCSYPHARGDQCDNCGRLLDAVELIDPHCQICGTRPVLRKAEQLFFNLPALERQILDYIDQQTHWRPNVHRFVRNYVAAGLLPRAATRDIDWGIPVPIEAYRDKVMYVWIEAVMGYLSASVEWAHLRGTPDAWKDWWYDSAARSYYFIGKDNIPFHAIIWPAELMGYDAALNLPYDIPANEFLNLEEQKFSTGRNWAIWLPDALQRYASDALRYYLTAIAPESADTEFTWAGFVERNNNELVATWGNLVHRVLTFAFKHWNGCIPEPGPLGERDVSLLDTIEAGFASVGNLYAGTHFKAALREAMALAREVNRYLDERSPWTQIKTDRVATGTTIFVAIRAIDSLKMLFAPVLPHSSESLHRVLGYAQPLFGEITIEHVREKEGGHDVLKYKPLLEEGTVDRWRPSDLKGGSALERAPILFSKLDEAIIEDEQQRLQDQIRASRVTNLEEK